MNINFSDIQSVRVNKRYEPSENPGVRHLILTPQVKTSISGQFAQDNFKLLVTLIYDLHKGGKIFFVDTRNDPHFELNGYSVCLKTDYQVRPEEEAEDVEKDDNAKDIQFAGESEEAICNKEKELAQGLVKANLAFKGKLKGDKEQIRFIDVAEGTTVRDYVMADPHNFYVRLAIPRGNVVSDAKIDEFLTIIKRVEAEDGWLHLNEYIGSSSGIAAQLMALKAIYDNVGKMSLKEIGQTLGKCGEVLLKDPEQSDRNFEKQTRLRELFSRFYEYCCEKHDLSWSAWIAHK